jgi:hypothetical protein
MIEERLDGIDARLDGVDARVEDFGRHMRVLHEDLRSDLRALAESIVLLGERMDRRFDAMAADGERHTAVLEGVLRTHTAMVGSHDDRITALERDRRP